MGKWVVFHLIIVALLILDGWKGSYQKKNQKQALISCLLAIVVPLIYNGYIYFFQGQEPALQFFTAFLIEKFLSIDNLFVFLAIFSFFKVPFFLQHRVLMYGILGAIGMRFILISGGILFIQWFHQLTWILGGILIFTAIKLLMNKNISLNFKDNFLIRWIYKHYPVTSDFQGESFWIKDHNKWYLTPLFMALVMIEITDLIFAIDSIPAVLSITRDPFIAYTSNIFAILSLRSLYLLLSSSFQKFSHLHVGLGLILLFIGIKMFIEPFWVIPTTVVLITMVGILAIWISLSLFKKKRN